jgi:sec-independent protein translocase protein TatA
MEVTKMFRSLGPLEIGIILVIILIVFGVGKLPQVGGAIGKSIREFRKSSKGEDGEEQVTKVNQTADKNAIESGAKSSID